MTALSIITLSIMTVSTITLSIMTFNIMTLSMLKISLTIKNATLSITANNGVVPRHSKQQQSDNRNSV